MTGRDEHPEVAALIRQYERVVGSVPVGTLDVIRVLLHPDLRAVLLAALADDAVPQAVPVTSERPRWVDLFGSAPGVEFVGDTPDTSGLAAALDRAIDGDAVELDRRADVIRAVLGVLAERGIR